MKFSKLKTIVFAVMAYGLGLGALKAQPKANFTVDKTSGCPPLIVQFTDQSTGNPATYFWDFGNGNTSTLRNPGSIFITPGSFDITLIVTNNLGSDTLVRKGYITVNTAAKADFTADVTYGCSPLRVNFTNQSVKGTRGIQSYLWDFGNGQTSTQANPKVDFPFSGGGIFSVTLVVTDSGGCKSTATKNNYITVENTPTADFSTATTISCVLPLKVDFIDNSINNKSTPLQYFWNFGNGQTSTQKNPSTTYNNYGNYTVYMIVVDSAGCKDTITKPGFISISPVTARFKISDTAGCVPLKVNFTDSSTSSSQIVRYFWSFGDGDTSTQKNPVKTYRTPGKYSVTLRVVTADSCTDSIVRSQIIEVYPKPNLAFSSVDSISCISPFKVDFINQSTGLVSWLWTFGDTMPSTDFHPSRYFYAKGTYTVRLIGADQRGCKDTLTKRDFIRIQDPIARADIINQSGCAPIITTFRDASTSPFPIVKRTWDFGGNDQVDSITFTRMYGQGKFPFTLYIEDSKGCKASLHDTVRAGQKPTPSFSVNKQYGCIQDMLDVMYFNHTNDSGKVQADFFWWDFEIRQSFDWDSVLVPYKVPAKTYYTTLVAGQNGCFDTLTKPDYIEILEPFALFTFNRLACAPDSVEFKNGSVGGHIFHWDFGDGTTSNQKDPPKKKYDFGVFDVKLIVYDTITKCSDTAESKVNINVGFEVNFTADKRAGCTPLQVQFTNQSNRRGLAYWDFGNGVQDSGLIVKALYDKPGIYDVSLRFVDTTFKCEKTEVKKAYITAYGSFFGLSASPPMGCAPLNTTLGGSVNSVAQIKSAVWHFGDGATRDVTASPNYSASHTYTNPPTDQRRGYAAFLLITDTAGCSSADTVYVRVLRPVPQFANRIHPNCDSIFHRFSPVIGNANAVPPLTYLWDFGTTSSALQNPIVYYPAVGDYWVRLRVTDSLGCQGEIYRQTNINKIVIKANFDANNKIANCPPLLVQFADSSSSENTRINRWRWEFGDGTTSTQRNPSKLYQRAGDFGVKLIVTDTNRCSDSLYIPAFISIGGARGVYSFDKTRGCDSLTVVFTSAIVNAQTVLWDFGDGSLFMGANTIKHYNRTGQFIPLLILTDSLGCTYTLPPIDTIRIFQSPTVRFTSDTVCLGFHTQIRNTSRANSGTLTKFYYFYEDGSVDSVRNPRKKFNRDGILPVINTVFNSNGCSATDTQNVFVPTIKIAFDMTDSVGCVEGNMLFKARNLTPDYLIDSFTWYFGDGTTGYSHENFINHQYKKSGIFKPALVVKSVNGCKDTSADELSITVGRNFEPEPLPAYRVTVEDDFTTRFEFKRDETFDFAAYVIQGARPGEAFQPVATITNREDTVHIRQFLNTRFNSYCYTVQTRNICGYNSRIDSNLKHCTVELLAEPDINASQLSWNHYVGWNKINRYEIFLEDPETKGFYKPIGFVPGNQNTFTHPSFSCFITNFYRIRAVEEGGFGMESWSDTSAATPYHQLEIKAPIIRRVTVEDNANILVEWFPPFNNKFPIKTFNLQRSANGVGFNAAFQPLSGRTFSALDKKVAVNAQSYWYKINFTDSCGDLSPYSEVHRSIHLRADTNRDERPVLFWNHYEGWDSGVAFYEIEKINDFKQFELIQVVQGNVNQWTDDVSDFNGGNFCYRVRATANGKDIAGRTVTSLSNEACAPVRPRIWVPNAFTPNKDRRNPVFEVKAMFIREYNIKIFTRWGEKVFESNSLEDHWDGTYKDTPCPDGVYIYLIIAEGMDNEKRVINGNITLMR